MNLLFSMRHPGAVRNFASTLRELARRGHRVELVFMAADKLGDMRLLAELTADHPGISFDWARRGPGGVWTPLARKVRRAADYARYGAPEFARADALRERAGARVSPTLRAWLKLPGVRTRYGVTLAGRMLAAVERAIPPDPRVLALVRERNPDVLLVTPLVDLGSDQVEYVKAAQALGIRTGLCVHSWDNLTNKGRLRVLPDRVFVWNEAQRREAVLLHGVLPESVMATGAPAYDEWFDRLPSTTREEFCRKVGLRPDAPFFLYLCSSDFIAPGERAFIERWIAAVRSSSDAGVREAGILVRPHPRANVRPGRTLDLPHVDNLVVWPRAGANPVDAGSKNDYFDSLYHAAAAVGINTSAQIEAGIAGRAVHSVRAPEYAATQEGTLHFHYLLNESGGLLRMADSLDEHVRMLGESLRHGDEDARRARRFVEAFVRPRGYERAATPILADAIEELARLSRPAAAPTNARRRALRAGLYPLAVLASASDARRGEGRGPSERRASPSGLLTRAAALPASVFRWRPLRRYAQRHIVPRVLPQSSRAHLPSRDAAALTKRLQRLAGGSQPIVLGPWLNETSIELLYWIPFLHWLRTYRAFDPERLIVVSRGGAASWYRPITRRYVDVLDFYTAEQFSVRNAQRRRESKGKYLDPAAFDRELLDAVKGRIGAEADVVSPADMYRLFQPYWQGRRGMSLIESFTTADYRLEREVADLTEALPDDYVAVRFRFNESFPETDANRQFVRRAIQSLADGGHVVLLDPAGIEGAGALTAGGSRVHTIEPHLTPRNRLDLQTAVIGRARAFVGTWGGLSLVAPMQGVTSIAFYSERRALSRKHLEWTQRRSARWDRGAYLFDTRDLGAIGLAFAREPGAAAPVRRDAVGVRT